MSKNARLTNGQFRKSGIPNNNQKKKKRSGNRQSGDGTKVSLRTFDIMPKNMVRYLNYIDSNYVRNNGGANYLAYSFRINDLYDPDPLILTGLVSGFKEIMQFYTTYRVNQTHVSLRITNNEAFPLLYGYVFSQTALVGSLSSRDDAINALENDFSTRARLLAAKGGIDTDTIQTTLQVHTLLGNKKQYEAELGYTGQGVASPGIPLYLTFIIASPSGAALPNGVTTALTFTYRSHFFGRTNIRA
jgi:hypothetical protein